MSYRPHIHDPIVHHTHFPSTLHVRLTSWSQGSARPSGAGQPSLLIEYLNSGTVRASGGLYDIDGAKGKSEQFTVIAYDGNHVELDRVDTPLGYEPGGGGPACLPNGPASNNYDSHQWRFDMKAPEGKNIKYIRIDFIGTKEWPPMGFDNFAALGDCPGVRVAPRSVVKPSKKIGKFFPR